jgi:hypothetical protein
MPKPILIDPHGNCTRVVIGVALYQRDIAKCCREQHVGSGPLCDEESRDLGAITDEVLRWSRVVIIIELVNFGVMSEEKSGDLYLRANCSFRLPSPPLAWTRDGSPAIKAASSPIMPRLAI